MRSLSTYQLIICGPYAAIFKDGGVCRAFWHLGKSSSHDCRLREMEHRETRKYPAQKLIQQVRVLIQITSV